LLLILRPTPPSTLFPYTTLFRSRKNTEENAPSRKYLSAASWLMSRRRRASAQSTYSGSDSTSSATNIVMRSLAAANSIMPDRARSEEHTSELQSRENLVCRLLLE